LPEAQLDRFMFNLWLDYPSFDEEKAIVSQTTSLRDDDIKAVIDKPEIIELQNLVRQVPVPDNVLEAAVKLVNFTRPKTAMADDFVNKYLSWGAGPRASQFLILGGKAKALSQGRANVTLDDIRSLAIPVLRHRIVTNYAAEAEGLSPADIIRKLIEKL